MSNTCEALDTCSISPVRPKTKNTTTPIRTRSKTFRREQGVDVHTVSCSTPTAPLARSPRLQRSSQSSPRFPTSGYNSPSSSIPCSQDNRPDVVWDFNSPKLSKGSRKKELKITVQELLENLNQCQASKCNSKSSPYIALLENWMSKQHSSAEAAIPKIGNNKKEVKKKSKHRIEELRKFIESIQRTNKVVESASQIRSSSFTEKKDHLEKGIPPNHETSFRNSFLDGNKSDDSSEELWGDMDNSFIIKATQEIDKVTFVPPNPPNQAAEIVSTIPETIPCPPKFKCNSPSTESEKHSHEQLEDFLLHLTNVDWDDCDDEWENGFLVEDDDLCLVSEDVLSGNRLSRGDVKESQLGSKKELSNNPKTIIPKAEINSNEKCPKVFNLEGKKMCLEVPNAELFNSFEDDSFEEEAILFQPEILSRLDEVENMLSQPKCTPEEIKKKKDEALRRRKKHN